MDLFLDHRNNVAMYPEFQKFIREGKVRISRFIMSRHIQTVTVNLQVPLIVFWGSKDPVFVPAGADAYKRDVPNVHVKHLDAGHFLT